MNPTLLLTVVGDPRVATAPGAAAAPASADLAAGGGSVLLALLIGVLFAAGTYLALQRALTRVVIGLGLITHAANLLLIVAGGVGGPPAFVRDDGTTPDAVVDPLPQAMVLTAIVIAFSVTALLLALAYRSLVLTRDDVVQDDIEDRRVAAQRPTDTPDEPEWPSDFTPQDLARIRADERHAEQVHSRARTRRGRS